MGEVLLNFFKVLKVGIDLCYIVDLFSIIVYVKLVDGQVIYVFYDENIVGWMLIIDDLLVMVEVDVLFFGGILLVVEFCGSIYEVLMMCEVLNCVIMIDLNICLSFIKDEVVYCVCIDWMFVVVDIVKLFDEDLVWLVDGDDILVMVWVILDKGVKLVCIIEGVIGLYGFIVM